LKYYCFLRTDFLLKPILLLPFHTIETPISSIKLSLQLLEKAETGIINEDQKQLIDSKDGQRLLKLLGTIGIVAVRNGNIKLNMEKSNPYEIMYATRAVKVQAEQNKIELVIETEQNLPDIKADSEKNSMGFD
jgi:signal transduction histidine kinase